MGLVAPQHVGSSQTRAQTRVTCIGKRILNHCATREALAQVFSNFNVHENHMGASLKHQVHKEQACGCQGEEEGRDRMGGWG